MARNRHISAHHPYAFPGYCRETGLRQGVAREGELIFAYIYETSGVDKPVERLWISSMTKQAIREGFEQLRPGEQLRQLEAAARSRSEADWLVGMNATRAATIRGRAWVGGVVSLGRVQTPTLALMVKREREI